MRAVHYLIIDWGTTNFRAFAMNSKDICIDKIERPIGLLSIAQGLFAQTLSDIFEEWLGEYTSIPVYMAGMVGSANGWKDAGYVATPANVSNLSHSVIRFALPWGSCAYIVPGVRHVIASLQNDVMRGEEVQVLGLTHLCGAESFTVLLPGTHSKHVEVRQKKIQTLATFMTGEMFSLLTKHSILGKDLPAQQENDEVFKLGISQAKSNKSLLNLLFSARTNRLFEQVSDDSVYDYLSGVLIGHELQKMTSNVYIVGENKLANRYKLACDNLSIKAEIFSGDDCFLAGMKIIKDTIYE